MHPFSLLSLTPTRDGVPVLADRLCATIWSAAVANGAPVHLHQCIAHCCVCILHDTATMSCETDRTTASFLSSQKTSCLQPGVPAPQVSPAFLRDWHVPPIRVTGAVGLVPLKQNHRRGRILTARKTVQSDSIALASSCQSKTGRACSSSRHSRSKGPQHRRSVCRRRRCTYDCIRVSF